MRPGRAVAAALAAATLAGTAAAQPAAEAPWTQATVFEIVRALRDDSQRYSYQRTDPPDARTNLCAGQQVREAPGADSRLAVVAVPYAGGEAPKLDLNLQFDRGSDVLRPESRELLQTVARALADPALQRARFAVAGHADVSGNEPENLRLSCARAISARNFLLAQGVAAERVSAYGFGSARLLAGHASNAPIHRRVEIRRAP